jgi:hypothetical protein
MVQRALVYKTGSTAESHVYVGQMEFSANLSVAGTNSYLHNGVRQVVHIDRIEPPTWSPNSEIVPTVFVSPVAAKESKQS